MTTTVKAIYERNSFRVADPLPIREGEEVTLTIATKDSDLNPPRPRFRWETGPILPSDSYSGSVADELRRQRDED